MIACRGRPIRRQRFVVLGQCSIRLAARRQHVTHFSQGDTDFAMIGDYETAIGWIMVAQNDVATMLAVESIIDLLESADSFSARVSLMKRLK